MKYVTPEKPVATKHDGLGKISFSVEVVEPENLQDCIKLCGSEERLVAFMAGQIATNAKVAARASARNYVVAPGTPAEAIPGIIAGIEKRGQELAREYTPAATTGRTGSGIKAKAATHDALVALLESGEPITEEMLAALVNIAK